MNIPNLINEKVVDKDGYLTPAWQNLFAQLFTALQNNLSNEGYILPQLPTAEIAKLNTTASTGAIIYDSTTNQIKGNISGTFQVII